MGEPATLLVRLPIAEVSAPTDRGWCDRLRCELAGAVCSARHQARETLPAGGPDFTRPIYPHCASCPTGKLVTLRLRQSAPPTVKGGRIPIGSPLAPKPAIVVVKERPCAVPGCTGIAHKPRKTVAAVNVWGLDLCRQHRALVAARCVPGREHEGQHQGLADYLRKHGHGAGYKAGGGDG